MYVLLDGTVDDESGDDVYVSSISGEEGRFWLSTWNYFLKEGEDARSEERRLSGEHTIPN